MVSVTRQASMSFIWIIGVLIIWLSLSFSAAWGQDENVAKVQQLLSALGYDPGKADGLMGPRTRRAIAAYQRSHNLPPTSELDEPTLRALGLLATPQAPEVPPAPAPPPAPWRTVLAYLRYYDTQPSQLVPYLTEHFRQGAQAHVWIRNTKRDLAAQNFSRLSWRIERVEPQEPEAASEATVEVYSRVRISGEEMARREIFSLVRADETTWLINDLKSLAVSDAAPEPLKPESTTADR
ncbi:MAG: hypothetical protein ETSY1_02580 [Candidatus Entotheonella factor]|uniref:Peptidoglycan binding-like domain-containing protein n=1 Tax=Entotheonella factor TaxID=1429438 RepID=W4LYA8_ENTF1|nr:MAG: hypothetical protein ETSY1_02580 [Candidatus Entotheonella factor]